MRRKVPDIRRGDLVRVQWKSPQDDWPTWTVRYVGWDGVCLQGRPNSGIEHDHTHTFARWSELKSIRVEGHE
jgi:hypothetical protein